MWIVIIIVCIAFVLIMEPIERVIRKRFVNKWVQYILNFIIAFGILTALYGIAALLGYNVWM